MGTGSEEAIAAVQDEEQFYGDEDDFDDLYGDLNFGEGFHLPNIRSEEPAPEASLPAPPPPLLPPAARVPEKVHVEAVAEEARVVRPSGVFERGFRGEGGDTAAAAQPPPPVSIRPELGQNPSPDCETQGSGFANGGFPQQGGGFGGPVRQGVSTNGHDAGEGAFGGTTLFVGGLHWWTTDAQLDEELCKYGQAKEIKFFEEKASGKSKGCCQVDFYDPMTAAACKDNMNGHQFNGKPCVVAHASPATVRRMGEAQLKNNNLIAQPPPNATLPNGRDGVVGGGGGGGRGQQMGGNYGRGGGGSGNGGWGRGGRMGNARNRMGPAGGRGIMGNGAMVAPPPMMHPGPMMGQGFDPTGYGAAMGRMAGPYGGFSAGPVAAAFPGMMPSFPPGVNPHMNPAFFGRGRMPPGAGGVGMWPDQNMGGWAGEELLSYGDDAASEQHSGEANYAKDMASERGRSGAPDRRHEGHEEEKMTGHGQEFLGRHYDDRELSRERDREKAREKVKERERKMEREKNREREGERERHRDDRDRHGDHHHRHRDRSDNRDRAGGRSSRPRSRSREPEYSKRRRLSPI